VEFFSAVEGNKLKFTEKDKFKEIRYQDRIFIHEKHSAHWLKQKVLVPNVLGCALSHYMVYEQFVHNSSCDALFVMEDDLFIDADVSEFWTYLRSLPPLSSFDVCFFSNRHCGPGPYPLADQINDYYYHIQQPFLWYSGTSGYLCTRRGMRTLYQPEMVIRFAADDYLNYMINSRELVSIAPRKPLIVGHGRLASDIDRDNHVGPGGQACSNQITRRQDTVGNLHVKRARYP
jgi:GR25 family glycosyltransferase involved in LPS biosynthesis